LKICHGATVKNVVNSVCAKCGNDRSWNEKALTVITTRTRTTFVEFGEPCLGLKNEV